jgi:hypothetical protein
MPTDLPVRSDVQKRSGDQAKSGQPLLMFYGIAVLAVLLLVSIETRFGMFDGLNVSESALQAIGDSDVIDGIQPNWASFTAPGEKARDCCTAENAEKLPPPYVRPQIQKTAAFWLRRVF